MKSDPKKFSKKRLDSVVNNSHVTWAKKQKIEPQNIVTKLIHRSMNLNKKAGYLSYRKFYQSITPNFTVSDVKKPPGFPRKFTPCGKYLIGFSQDQTSVDVYDYQGAAAANELLHSCPIPAGDVLLEGDNHMVHNVLSNIFGKFFKLRGSINLATNHEQLNRESSIFTSDGRYIIVCSATPRDLTTVRPLTEPNRNNESVTPNPRAPLDDYTFYLVKIDTIELCDKLIFKHDKIYMAHNQGLSLYNKTLVVCSVQHQTLHIYQVEEGKFIKIQEVGKTCHTDDSLYLESCIAHDCASSFEPEDDDTVEQNNFARTRPNLSTLHSQSAESSSSSRPAPENSAVRNIPESFRPSRVFSSSQSHSRLTYSDRGGLVFPRIPKQRRHDHSEGSNIIYSLKQKILVYLYWKAQEKSEEMENKTPIRQFYSLFDVYVQLRILKIQLLNEETILIKYASEDVVTLRSSEPSCQPSYFVVYDFKKAEILEMYDSNSQELVQLYEQYTDYFRNPRLTCEPNYFCSPSNNIYARQVHLLQKSTLVSSRGGGVTEANRRLLTQLPVACQAFSPSPYLDLNLFSYQEKQVSVMERPKTVAEQPIRFFGRDSGLFKFSLNTGIPNFPSINKRLVAFTFHPIDPFCISVQKKFDYYVVSFHLRHTPR